jgi:UDP:flavonoid glycosyltransferase YjiC (YdhE family)
VTDKPRLARPRIILATSNGTGMGHLARQVAIALALDRRAEPIFFSMSLAMPAVLEFGMRGEYCPSYHRELMPRPLWDRYLADRIRALVAETKADVLVFDGVAPYRGLLWARAALPRVAFVWVRRALWRPGVNTRSLRSRRFFDLVIEPGDLALAADRGQTAHLADARRISPVTLGEQVQRLPREAAAAKLGLDPSRPTALVTLRGDPLADHGQAAVVVRELLTDPDWQVAVPRRPINVKPSSPLTPGPIVVLPEVFPLARYLSAFDVAVSEAGYNSFHEFLLGGIPTTLVPTSAAVTDDQETRAEWAAAHGVAIWAREEDSSGIAAAVKQLVDPAVRVDLQDRCAALPRLDGAVEAADILVDLSVGFGVHRLRLTERVDLAMMRAQSMVERAMGTRLRAAARMALRRSPERGPASRRSVRLMHQPEAHAGNHERLPLAFAESLTRSSLAAAHPTEHLLQGSSAGYRAERERIARRYYHVDG